MLQKWWVKRKKWIWNIFTPDTIILDSPVLENYPGLNSEKINPDIEVQWGTQSKAESLSFSINWGTVWSETTFSWFWFRPKKVMIQWRWAVWLWYFNADWVKRDQTTTQIWETWDLIYMEQWAFILAWTLKEFTDDWFIVTWNTTDSDIFFFYATCFSEV